MHTFGYLASAFFFLVEIGFFLCFIGNLIVAKKTKGMRLRTLYRGSMIAMVLAIVYPVVMLVFTALYGIFDSLGCMFILLAICPVALEKILVTRNV